MNTKNGVCKFCGRSGKGVVDEVCEICVRGWDYELELELRAEYDAVFGGDSDTEQEELDARECPIAQENLGGVC